MAVSIAELAGALRVGDGVTAPAEPEYGIVVRLRRACQSFIEHHAPNAPTQDQALVQMAAYLYDQPSAGRGVNYAAAFRNSGAGSILAPWTTRRLAVHVPEPVPVVLEPFFYIGWTQQPGFDLTTDQALAAVITPTEFAASVRYDGDGPHVYPSVPFTPSGADGYAYYWVAVRAGRGEPPGGTALNGQPQGTGLTANASDHEGVDGEAIEFYIWPAALNPIVGNGTYSLTLLGYTEA